MVMVDMEQKSTKLLHSLKTFYIPQNMSIFLKIINSVSSENISLRLIDWLVTNYSKANNVVYYVHNKPFNMHQHYKNMLKAYSKKFFDPFRRHDRIFMDYVTDDGKQCVVETTVAQLAFFKWAIEFNVIEYAISNKQIIKKDMDTNTNHRIVHKKNVSSNDVRLKRKELSKSSKGATIYNVNIRVTFS